MSNAPEDWEELENTAAAEDKAPQADLSSKDKRRAVKLTLNNLGLEDLEPSPPYVLPEVDGYITIPESQFSRHPELQGMTTWLEEYDPTSNIYAGYSLPVTSELDEERISHIAFIYYDAVSQKWVEKRGIIATFSGGRKATWYSENSEQTRKSRPVVPVAILLKKAPSSSHEEMKIYSFTIQDKDPECLTFGCIAPSLEKAQAKARRAGYREFVLMDVRNPTGVELSDVANLELLSNPLLGNEWLPLVSALEAAITDIPVGAVWGMDFMGKAYSYHAADSPYTQAIVEGDGSLHLEIGPTAMLEERTADHKQLLAFLGWEAPSEGLPNYNRLFEPGWNPRHVATVFLQTVSLILDITTADLFTFSGNGVKQFDPDGLMDHLSEKDGRFKMGEAWGFWGKHPFTLKEENKNEEERQEMSPEPRLDQLITELFIEDPRSITIFPSELLESLDMDLAQEALDDGKRIPNSCYTDFDTFVRRLKADPERTTRLHNFDVFLSATLSRLIDTRDNFYVALWRADSAGGPYINFSRKQDKYEVTLMSNYRQLEKRENWFAAAISLFEWYAYDTGFLGVKLYRKSWSLEEDPVEIASAISLVVTYVLDALASGYSLVQIPQLQDSVFMEQYKKGQLSPVLDDASMGWRLIEAANKNGFHPPISQYRAGMDSLVSQHNLRDAIDIAAENDDELGMYSLEQVLEDVHKREELFKPVLGKLREFISLSTDLPSIRILPFDHPGFEGLEAFEVEEFDAPREVSPNFEKDDQKFESEIFLDENESDGPEIYEGTSEILWHWLRSLEGKEQITEENNEDEEFLLACLLGNYLREITGFNELHDMRHFLPAFENREKERGPKFSMVADGDYGPTVFNKSGIYQGVTTSFQRRAAKVFETLLAIRALSGFDSKIDFINSLSDQTLMDCTIWSMLNNRGNQSRGVDKKLLRAIAQIVSRPPRI